MQAVSIVWLKAVVQTAPSAALEKDVALLELVVLAKTAPSAIEMQEKDVALVGCVAVARIAPSVSVTVHVIPLVVNVVCIFIYEIDVFIGVDRNASLIKTFIYCVTSDSFVLHFSMRS